MRKEIFRGSKTFMILISTVLWHGSYPSSPRKRGPSWNRHDDKPFPHFFGCSNWIPAFARMTGEGHFIEWPLFAVVFLVLAVFSGSAEAKTCVSDVCIGLPCKTFAMPRPSNEGVLSCIPKSGNDERDCLKDRCVWVTTSTQIPKKALYGVDYKSLTAIDVDCRMPKEKREKIKIKESCDNACDIWCRSVKGGRRGAFDGEDAAGEWAVCSCAYLE